MSDTRNEGANGRLFSALAPREWSLRRKVALAVLIPIALAAVFGGLRVRNDLAEADNYSASASQVTVLRPGRRLPRRRRERRSSSRGRRPRPTTRTATPRSSEVVAAGDEFEDAVEDADLTSDPARSAPTSVLDLQRTAARAAWRYVERRPVGLPARQLQPGVNQLIDTIVAEQHRARARGSQLLGSVIDGRVSLAIQQFTVAYQDGKGVKPIDLAAEVGVEAVGDRPHRGRARHRRRGRRRAARRRTPRTSAPSASGGTDLGDATAYAPYDRLSTGDARRHRREPGQRRRRGAALGPGRRAHHARRAARRDLPGAARLAPAARPDPPGARGRARGRPGAAAGGGPPDPCRW